MPFSVAVPRTKKPLASAMLRKYSRLRRPGGLRREYKKLRSLLPGATRSRHLRKKVGVVEAAYQYICQLQAALLDKFSTKGVPEDLAGIVRGKVATASDIQALALHLINNSPSLGNINNNNNNNNFLRSNNVSATISSIRPPHIPRSTQQCDLRLPQIISNVKPESEIPSVPKTNSSLRREGVTVNPEPVVRDDVRHESPSSATVAEIKGCFNISSVCDSSTSVPTDYSIHRVDGEVPLLSRTICDISSSMEEETSMTTFDFLPSGSSKMLCPSHTSITIEK